MPILVPFCFSVLEYELLNLQIPTIAVVGSLIKSGVPVMIYRYRKLEHESRNFLKLDFSFFYTIPIVSVAAAGIRIR